MRSGPLILIAVFGLLMAGVLVITQTIATTVSSAASAYAQVGTTTAEQEGKTERTGVIVGFLQSLFGGVSAAVI